MEVNLKDLKNSPLPKYYRIKEFLLNYIKKKKLKPGDGLPSENKLASMFKVTKMTASHALNELVSQGILYRIQGKGTFVTSIEEKTPPIYLYLPLVSSLDPYFTGPLIGSFAHTLAEKDYSLTIKYFPDGKKINLNPAQQNSGAMVVAALKEGEGLSENSFNFIKTPVIYLGSHPEELVDCIAFTNEEGAKKAVDYLVKLGHQKIAFFSGNKDNISNQEREKGYLKGLEVNGLNWRLILSGNYSEESDYQRTKKLLQRKQGPTAILCASDLIALGIMCAFRETGLRVPRDISIVGFGDYEVAHCSHPSLTTVSLPIKEMGKQLAELAIARIENKNNFKLQRIILPTKLVIRKSARKRNRRSG